MLQQENSDIKEILRLVREIHVKVNEPSAGSKMVSGVKDALKKGSTIIKRVQTHTQKGGRRKKGKTKKNIK